MDTVLSYALTVGQVVLIALGAAVAILTILAPLTKTDADNKALAFLQKGLRLLESLLGKAVPAAVARAAAPKVPPVK